MDEQRMEEDGVTGLHLYVSARRRCVIVLDAVVRFVHAALKKKN